MSDVAMVPRLAPLPHRPSRSSRFPGYPAQHRALGFDARILAHTRDQSAARRGYGYSPRHGGGVR